MGSAVNAGETAKVAVEDNYLNAITDNSLLKKDITYQSFNNEIIKCKNSSNGCTDELKKYWSEHQANFNKLKAECADGGLVCPSWEELIVASLNTAQKLSDPDARKIATLMLTQDLIMLENGIDFIDRTYSYTTDPLFIGSVVLTRKPGGSFTTAQTKQILKKCWY